MSISERDVRSCYNSLKRGIVSEYRVRRVLNLKFADVSCMEEFLDSDDDLIKRSAIRIIGKLGNMKKLMELAKSESGKEKEERDVSILSSIIQAFRKRPEGVDELVDLLSSDDHMVVYDVVDLFRSTGNKNLLFVLLFNRDEELTDRIKKYLNEE
jgi:HEAT repeat protein